MEMRGITVFRCRLFHARICCRLGRASTWPRIRTPQSFDGTRRMDPRFRGDDGLRRLDPNAGTTAEWRSYSDDDLAPRMIARHTVDSLGRSVSHNNSTAVTKMIGKITSLMAVQPNLSSSWPEENELSAMLPKIRKSLNA